MVPSLADMGFPSMFASYLPPFPSHFRRQRTMDDFLQEVKQKFEAPLRPSNLLAISAKLQKQFKEKLRESHSCMLPSFNHTLPTGHEKGKYLALDVGGSTFRVALVHLAGKDSGSNSMEIVKMYNFRIGKTVRDLKGHAFFDWMAERICETLEDPVVKAAHGDTPLPMGLAWSFPVEQTSMGSGILLEMGKGFHASVGTLGQDLGELVNSACKRKNLNVHLDAIINDSSATLLSRAYVDPKTRLSLILGTGFNAAAMLPIHVLHKSKFGPNRPQSWYDEAEHVVVNTELSMFGQGALPMTRWDDHINRVHMHPNYQPFEHFLGGRYLGEIVRLILVEAIEQYDLFGGKYPATITEPYALETGVLAVIDSDNTPDLSPAATAMQTFHPLPSPTQPSLSDLRYVQTICKLVTTRAAALLAMGIHALWTLYYTSNNLTPSSAGTISIACNGSIIERYPGFRERCQGVLDELTALSQVQETGVGERKRSVSLEVAYESAIFGAAVSVCCLKGVEHVE